MIIELLRATTPEDYGGVEDCWICGERFRTEHVLAIAELHGGTWGELVCPACVELLGSYKPERFPTREEYEAAKRRWAGPIWSSKEEESEACDRLDDASFRAVLGANRISRFPD